ncbi:hypothetical protein L1276_004775 [Flavobacterium sp. HSC-32F16]|uniref:carboxypeptidase-like regulatory domain-containing protein n=1 Tax=Flavobacterium sp. HSC-32F16 TaxID=2910964 RepID=UPI0020A4DC73|nr:carboxypeptidase-like regulatory domain-containing protein [Flavobacterium sp. HSC-32F16]MCP2029588.1 hypothetical protein [Flavobacterium sp. HSC-32F16]
MKKYLIIAFAFTSIFVNAQNKTITGIILDSLKQPIPYANIGILNKPVGTVSNEKGEFSFILENTTNLDTLRISSLSYISKDILLKNLSDEKLTLILKNHIEKLNEIIVSRSNLKNYNEGKDKSDTKQQVLFANPNYKNMNLGTEIGRKFSLGTKKPSLLTEFKFFIKENNFKKVKFRINIYSIQNNKPDKKLNNSDIYSEVENSLKNWTVVDLTPFNIITQQDIIIAVEWIEHSNDGNKLSLPIIIPSFNSTHYYKFGSQGIWEKYGKISSSMILFYQQ